MTIAKMAMKGVGTVIVVSQKPVLVISKATSHIGNSVTSPTNAVVARVLLCS